MQQQSYMEREMGKWAKTKDIASVNLESAK